MRGKAPAEYEVNFVTTAGEFTIKVTRAWSPNGADLFYNLVRHHFYDGVAFFRVLPGFMAQFGLSPYPEVSRAWEHATIKDDPLVQSNHRGFVTYAMTSERNSRSTQIFINTGNNERLDADKFTPFGVVTEGMEVVDKLYGGYGEGAPDGHGPDQNLVGSRGRAYLEKNFPETGCHQDSNACDDPCGESRSEVSPRQNIAEFQTSLVRHSERSEESLRGLIHVGRGFLRRLILRNDDRATSAQIR